MSDALPEPLRYTGFLIRRAQQVHAAVWATEVSSVVSSVQYGVLAVLDRKPNASQRELCDDLDLDRSTIADIVARLHNRGMIERGRSVEDRRANVLRLSAAGRSELGRLRPRVEEVERILTRDFSKPESVAFRALLERVVLSDSRRQSVQANERA